MSLPLPVADRPTVTDVEFHGQAGTADEDRCGGVSGGDDDDVNALSLDGAPPWVARAIVLDVETRFLSLVLFVRFTPSLPCSPMGHTEVKNVAEPPASKQELGEFTPSRVAIEGSAGPGGLKDGSEAQRVDASCAWLALASSARAR